MATTPKLKRRSSKIFVGDQPSDGTNIHKSGCCVPADLSGGDIWTFLSGQNNKTTGNESMRAASSWPTIAANKRTFESWLGSRDWSSQKLTRKEATCCRQCLDGSDALVELCLYLFFTRVPVGSRTEAGQVGKARHRRQVFRTPPSAIQYPGNVAFRWPLITTPTTDVPTVP
ncbi:hypothetical protein DAPPUDRAFT_103866 [Daphnia pulex]|uniref:Uncharacterized protein n=1 Tax=Daphnia pulex TaxID=6669 RepID=E9GKL3_DAPPU|nr:hypothetical protein DAPPUDRAFT_103866 [Daphnia pulex]|eukprot:EFX80042.1 hypothetical protein DAPPUDRAFT_103866 [Daphnia pulex]